MFYEGKRVLVAGATGLVGANLVERLLEEGARIKATFHQKPAVIQDQRIEYIRCDLTQKEDCGRAVEDVEYVFHCAAHISGALVMAQNPLAHITQNLIINAQMLEAAYLHGVDRFLFISSSTVYPPVTHPVKEEEAFVGDPYEGYFGLGWMNRYIEKLCEFYHRRYGLRVIVVRPTNPYGPYDKFDFETAHVLPALIRRALERHDPFEVWGDGTAVRDFLYVGDMVDAMLVALEKAADGGPINVSSGTLVTIRESVDLILKLSGYADARVAFDATKPSTIPMRQVDLTRAREVLGFQPKVSFEEGLRRTIDWYRAAVGTTS